MSKKVTSNNRIEKLIDHLSDHGAAKKLLNQLNIDVVDDKFEITSYYQEFGTSGLILKSVPIADSEPVDIIIDIKPGRPSTSQVCDVIYERGKDFAIRIIVFLENVASFDSDDDGANKHVVGSLIDAMNEYPINLYMLKVTNQSCKNNMPRFECLKSPGKNVKYSMADLPTLEFFKVVEFWMVYFFHQDHGEYYKMGNIFGNKDRRKTDSIIITPVLRAECALDWNECGIFFSAGIPIEYYNIISKFFLSDEPKTNNLYYDYPKPKLTVYEKNFVLVLQAWDIPVKRLYRCCYSEKMAYALLIETGYSIFVGAIESLIELIDLSKKQTNRHKITN